MKITILYDNDAQTEGVQAGWGFACWVEHNGERLLFDTGWDGDQVIDNAAKLGVPLEATDKILISHKHWDHMGGLARLLGVVPKPEVFVPASLSSRLKREIARRGAVVEITGGCSVGRGMRSTGELHCNLADGGELKEQALLVDGSAGTTIITGCAHPGLDRILQATSSSRVTAVVGGFHGFSELDRMATLTTIVPCHCTQKKDAILGRFPGSAQRGGVGLELELDGDGTPRKERG